MKVVIFDTETNGKPKKEDYKAPSKEWHRFPRMLEIAWRHLEFSDDFKVKTVLDEYDTLLKQESDFILDDEAEKIHNIGYHDLAMGENKLETLFKFANAFNNADVIIAHNLSFDAKIVKAEMHKIGLSDMAEQFNDKEHFCTMMSTVKYVGLKNGNRTKWASLNELYNKCFEGKTFEAHAAYNDVIAVEESFEYMMLNAPEVREKFDKFKRDKELADVLEKVFG